MYLVTECSVTHKPLPTLVHTAPTCTSGHSPGETQQAEVLQSAAARQVLLTLAGLTALFGRLSTSYMMPVTVCGFKTHSRPSFVQEGFRMGVGRMTLSLPRVPGSLWSIPGMKLAKRWTQPHSLMRQRQGRCCRDVGHKEQRLPSSIFKAISTPHGY